MSDENLTLNEMENNPNAQKPDNGISSFPPSVFCIIGNEFCERFCFYGMKAILPIYLTAWLRFSENASTTIIHSFNFAAYFFTLFGTACGIISDSWLGKFWTILSLSFVYCLGSTILAITSFPGISGNPPSAWGCFVGLFLLAFGTGGIKPCVSSFGGDQFNSSQLRSIAIFFSAFYFTVNAGSVMSMLITPLLRSNVHCYGQNSCYPLAFGLPALLMMIATIILASGYKLYRHVRPEGNVVLKVCKASWYALSNRSEQSGTGSHWLDRAYPTFDVHFIDDCKRLFQILLVFTPICLFWALFDQQGSRWTYQAMLMYPVVRLFGVEITIKPEQMGLVNAVLILVMIPVFNKFVYPFLGLVGFSMRPLVRMMMGMFLSALSFLLAAILQFAIISRGTFSPSADDPQTLVCTNGCVHILYQVPQYIFITAAEIMCSITGIEFAYNQAPQSMKSVCQAAWLLTVAAGNLVVIIFTELDPVGRLVGQKNKHVQSWNFLFWTLIIIIGMIIFAWISNGYQYHERSAVQRNQNSETTESHKEANEKEPLLEKPE